MQAPLRLFMSAVLLLLASVSPASAAPAAKAPAADPVIECSVASDQVEARCKFAVAQRQPAAIVGAVTANDDVSSHAPSASASPIICRMPNACS